MFDRDNHPAAMWGGFFWGSGKQFFCPAGNWMAWLLGNAVIQCPWIALSQGQSLFHSLLTRIQSLKVLRITPAQLNGFENCLPQKSLLIRSLCRAEVLSSTGQFRTGLSNRLLQR
jgi:hypothetical protein